MKKLLLTLFTIAAIVACQKDDSISQVETIVPSSETIIEDIQGAGLLNDDILNIVDQLLGTSLIKGSEQGDNPLTSKGADRVTLNLFQRGSEVGIAFVDESNDRFCYNAIDGLVFLSAVHLNKQDGSNNIEVTIGEDPAVISTLNGDYSSLFSANFNLLLMLDANGAIDRQGIFSAQDVGTAGSTTIRFGCAGDYYAVTDAPFPLDGHLATINDAAGLALAFGGSSLNYAGTDEDAVEAAIEANIIDGN